jgi:hypothetical protein
MKHRFDDNLLPHKIFRGKIYTAKVVSNIFLKDPVKFTYRQRTLKRDGVKERGRRRQK